jgi:hypothetical protein
MSPAQISSILPTLTPAQTAALSSAQQADIAALFSAVPSPNPSALAPGAINAIGPSDVLSALPSISPGQRAMIPERTMAAAQTLLREALAKEVSSGGPSAGRNAGASGASAVGLSQVATLSQEQLSNLKPTDMGGWDTAALQQLSPAQIASVPALALGALNTEQLQGLSPQQVQALSPEQLAGLAVLLAPEQLKSLSPNQKLEVRKELLADADAAAKPVGESLSPGQLKPSSAGDTVTEATSSELATALLSRSGIPPDLLGRLSARDWSQLDPILVAQIPSAILNSIPLVSLAAWSEGQMNALTTAQLSALDIPRLRIIYLFLQPLQIANLNSTQVQSLRLSQRFAWISEVGRDPQVLQSVLASYEPLATDLSLESLAKLSPASVNRLAPSVIQSLDREQIAVIQPAIFSALSNQQVRALRSDQIASLDARQLSSIFPWLSADQIQAISADQMSSLRNLIAPSPVTSN